MIVVASIIVNSLAALSGFCVVGNGRHWDFTVADYFRCKPNAILYLWVILSTISSIYLAGLTVEFGLKHHWSAMYPLTTAWFVTYISRGILIGVAHAAILNILSHRRLVNGSFPWTELESKPNG